MRAGSIDGDLLNLAEEAGRMAETVDEPGIIVRLHERAFGLLELAVRKWLERQPHSVRKVVA
jgi:hypothetical protein